MANTADIQVSANRGRTTQELHRDALSEKERETERGGGEGKKQKKGLSPKNPDQPALARLHLSVTHAVKGSVEGNLKLIGKQKCVSSFGNHRLLLRDRQSLAITWLSHT